MTEKLQVYKCEICGNIVEVLNPAGGTLVCCGQNMTLMTEQTADSATEKHVPVVEETGDGVKVTVGSTLHPMEEAHYIEWIEIVSDGKVYRENLKPGDTPVVEFPVNKNSISAVREYCSVHGLWKAE